MIRLEDFVASFTTSPLTPWASAELWELTSRSEAVVRQLLDTLAASDFVDEVAVHSSAVVASGAVLKGPPILGSKCFVASGAYLRGGNWVAERCVFGPGVEPAATSSGPLSAIIVALGRTPWWHRAHC